MSTTKNESITLKVYPRAKSGGNAAFKTRDGGLVPGVVYGAKVKTPFNVAFETNNVLRINKLAGKTGLVTLEITEGAPKELNGTKVLMKEIQAHPYKQHLVHVDLHQIDLTKKIRVVVPVNYLGKAKGLAEGGILNIVKRDIEIRCLPDQIPNHLDIDVSDVGLNESLHIEDVEKKLQSENKALEFIYESNYALVAVTETRDEVVAPVVGAVDAAAGAAAPGAAAGAAGAAAPGAAGAKGAQPAAGAKPAAGAAAPKAPAKK